MVRSYAIVALVAALVAPLVQANGELAESGPEKRLELRNVPLIYALNAIAALEGREIVVKGDIQGRQVSLTVVRGNLKRSIKRAMRGVNYILVSGADDKLTLWVPGAGEGGTVPADFVIQPQPFLITPASLFAQGPVVLPPDEEGQRGYTEADIAYYRSKQIPLDPALLEVVPPDDNDRGAMTWAEIQQIRKQKESLGTGAPVLPPSVPGGKGLTRGELESIRESSNESPDFARHHGVVPPD